MRCAHISNEIETQKIHEIYKVIYIQPSKCFFFHPRKTFVKFRIVFFFVVVSFRSFKRNKCIFAVDCFDFFSTIFVLLEIKRCSFKLHSSFSSY